MTHFLQDTLRQPYELPDIIDHLSGEARSTLDAAVDVIRLARHVYLTGISSSWHAALNGKSLFHREGFPVHTNEARLLWEGAVKAPATALGMGSFRHGPQEVIAPDSRFGVWIDGLHMRPQVLAVVRDLKRLGASVMLVGQDLPENASDLVFQLPRIPPERQFLTDIIPVQLAAERLAGMAGVDCDSFRLCPYVVDDEGGLPRGQEVQRENA